MVRSTVTTIHPAPFTSYCPYPSSSAAGRMTSATTADEEALSGAQRPQTLTSHLEPIEFRWTSEAELTEKQSVAVVMGQALARHQVEQGVRLYNDQKQEAAVNKWKKSLRKITKDTERFVTLGYLCQALADWGQYREMLDLAFQQLDIACEVDSPHLRAEAYLNLAVGNQRLGDYNKAVSYCRQSIYNYCDESRTTGHVHLCLGHAYLGLSNFYKSIECFDVALKIAKDIRDPALEIRSYIGLGDVFGQLNDHDKSMRLYAKAYDLVKGVKTSKGVAGGCSSQASNAGAGTYAKFLRLVLVNISGPLRRLGKGNEAYACTEDAMKMALRVKDKPIQAKCLSSFADIYRTKTDVDVKIDYSGTKKAFVQRAFSTYELAYSIMMDLGDKPGQLEVLSGMAKTLSLMTRLGRICDCKALEINNKVLEMASNLGNKMSMYSCHYRMQEIYHSLGDGENEMREERLAWKVFREMELTCGICRQDYGVSACRLEALPCSHVFHSKCVQEVLLNSERKQLKRMCPECSKSLNSRTFLVTYDDLQSNCPYSHFLDEPL